MLKNTTSLENNMQITAQEIDSVEEAGMLDGSPVKMIRTKGGFWICVGKPRNKSREEALGAGSHPAIVKFNVEKQYPDFQPALMKSELLSDNSVVDKHSHYLSDELRKSGHDVYSVQKGNKVEFHVTKNNINVASVKAVVDSESLTVQNLNIPQEFARALAGATTEKAIACNVEKIGIDRK